VVVRMLNITAIFVFIANPERDNVCIIKERRGVMTDTVV
jgi:hypothetical protein